LASDGFIREVDEELQRDRMARLWKRYGPLAIGIALVVIAATAGKVGWDAWQARQLAQQGAAFAAAEAARAGAEPSIAVSHYADLAETAGGNIGALAQLRQAEALLAAGDTATALTLLDEVAGNGQIDPVLRDFAAVSIALQRLDDADVGAALEALERRNAATGTFAYSARELTAMAALEAGDEATAISTLQALRADSGTPDGVRQRAEALLAALGVVDGAAESSTTETEEAS